ncbi:hypothetical protein LYNGBM3L_56660 [Moorena producens 3L]|uniref:Uncharacterized protein n=1 Tax=Moorena producens 3L TaxID=489825 RepID=F4XZ93_9CYAN|nr:hypothetical protein LYNGBM3L_56660 [Moorena producens 3L]OLT67798.1 hypothetical protein BI334_24670 [Moorena producens 3L]
MKLIFIPNFQHWYKYTGVPDYGYGFAPLAPQFCGATRGEFNSPTESAPVGEQNFLASPRIGGFRGL